MRASSLRLTFIAMTLILGACARSAGPSEEEVPATIVHSLSNGQIAYLHELREQGQMPEPDQMIPELPVPPKNACETFIASLPKDYFSGFLSVSEDPADPQSPNVQVFYYGRTVENQTPVVFFNGGPAADSHNAYKTLTSTQKTNAAWRDIPFLFIDQRGNGCSSAYPKGHTPEVLARLRHYGMRGIVHDAEAVRKHLYGDKPWKIFGQSYGAAIVHKYLLLYPNSVAAAFAHANAITTDSFERLANRLSSQNRVLEHYFEKYPDDRARLSALNRELTANRCFKNDSGTERVCGLRTISSFTRSLAFSYLWRNMHKWIETLVPKDELDEKAFLKFLSIFAFSNPSPTVERTNAAWAEFVIDLYDRDSPRLNRANCSKFIDILQNRGEITESFLLHECQATLQSPESPASAAIDHALEQLKSVYKTDALVLEDFVKARRAHSRIPFHLYSGELDPYVPVENFAEEVKALGPLATYTNFEHTGHDGFAAESQVWNDLAAPVRSIH